MLNFLDEDTEDEHQGEEEDLAVLLPPPGRDAHSVLVCRSSSSELPFVLTFKYYTHEAFCMN